MKYALGAMIGILILIVGGLFLITQTDLGDNIFDRNENIESEIAEPLFTPDSPPVSESPIEKEGVLVGTISGKLCYPSEFLPEGTIEAKDVNKGTVESIVYLGTEAGAESSYTMTVSPGTYVLRYNTGTSSGYYTDTCPTGLETSCNAVNPREHIEVVVESGSLVTGIDLCDFYYTPQTDPGF